MATALRTRTDGLHHAVSLGNIDVTSQTSFNYTPRNYESEDESFGRLKNRQQNFYIKPPIYSKEDIIDQYCLTDKQLNNSIEPPRRDRFFGCWSTRSQQSFLGVCVGRRAPSDENLQDYAPISRYPRLQRPISYDDDDLENSYFRRKPTSFLSSDAKRHTWVTMNNNDDSMRMEESRLNRNLMENGGPYVVESYPQKSSFLSQSTEQITGYRCPAHINSPANASSTPIQNQQDLPPRTKHVSFARSLTLASFDDAIGVKQNRILNARSQERLIGGKKPTITISHQQPQMPAMHIQAIPMLQKPQLQQTLSQPQLGQLTNQQIPETNTIEKHKRNVMKTQATQTEVYVGRKLPASQTLSLSPRTVHRVRMVSQGAQTNGMNGKKLSKSFSEMGTADAGCQYEEEGSQSEHEFLCRTQSEDSPKSPIDMSSYLKPSSGYMMTTAEIHAATQALSRQSQLETLKNNKHENFHYHHTYDNSNKSMETSNLPENFLITARRGSNTLSNEPIFIGRNELEQMRMGRPINPYEYESHSLPRRTCIHHKPEEYSTHSLPRREHHHHYLHDHSVDMKVPNSVHMDQIVNETALQKHMSAYQDAQPSYVNMNSETYLLSRRSSMQQQVPSVSINLSQLQQQHILPQKHCNQALQQVPPSDEMCSTCSSETQSETETENDDDDDDEDVDDESEVEACENDEPTEEEEKEIFIDFKPHFSPTSNTSTLIAKKKKKLVKAMSQGEILTENNGRSKQKPISMSEEDLKLPNVYTENLQYTDTPIRDEDICRANSIFSAAAANANASSALIRYDKDTFRKRSISLEDPLTDDMDTIKKNNKNLKANYSPNGSPGDGRSFASSDDVTREHSDGNWNESQVTILPCPPSPPDISSNSHSKRKYLQHQQRSSLDIEALDDIADQPLPPLPPIAQPIQKTLNANIHQCSTTSTLTAQTTSVSSIKPSIPGTIATPTVIVKPTPSIAVTHTLSIEQEDNNLLILPPHARTSSPSKKREMKKYIQQKNKHSAFDKFHRSNESLESNVKTSSESILNRNDISEGSTTEDYMTCTDNSKRTHIQSMRFAKGVTFPASQMPGTVSNSQTVTIDGSSFESASSFHSLARIDAICEDTAVVDEKVRSSPVAHSDSSTSSGSYRMPPLKISSPSRSTLTKPPHVTIKKNKKESVSDDERSEKFLSSSHDEKDHKTIRLRKPKEWNEEERRRKKNNFKLEIEKDSSSKMTMPSNLAKPCGVLKKISPEDKTALNILDGASPSKQKPRFRGKTRKTPRNRTPVASEDNMSRRSSKTLLNKSPEKPTLIAPLPQPIQQQQVSPDKSKLSPSKFIKPCHVASPPKHPTKKSTAIQRLKAISTESLRSVSPGSDSVFYNSEADILDHQIHCHHCGKEVEVVTAVAGGSEESVVIVDDGPDIVQPPEGFADSPNGISKVPPALKYYKRFRSEDRRHHKKGRNGRAKSEERNSEDITNEKLRGSGSSPCVGPMGPYSHDHHELEQGVYHGSYSQGSWIFISDKDFWRKNEILADVKYSDNGERRASTESEKEFRKKYQAITHRLVHRKSCVEMYRRQSSNSFGKHFYFI
ncbi:hypothetical protein ACKWTF_007294 [Chironomus riparius]